MSHPPFSIALYSTPPLVSIIDTSNVTDVLIDWWSTRLVFHLLRVLSSTSLALTIRTSTRVPTIASILGS